MMVQHQVGLAQLGRRRQTRCGRPRHSPAFRRGCTRRRCQYHNQQLCLAVQAARNLMMRTIRGPRRTSPRLPLPSSQHTAAAQCRARRRNSMTSESRAKRLQSMAAGGRASRLRRISPSQPCKLLWLRLEAADQASIHYRTPPRPPRCCFQRRAAVDDRASRQRSPPPRPPRCCFQRRAAVDDRASLHRSTPPGPSRSLQHRTEVDDRGRLLALIS